MPLASQHVAQEGEFDCDDPANQHKNLSGGYHDESSPAAQQELDQGSRLPKYAYIEVADDSESERSGRSQHLANLDGWPPAVICVLKLAVTDPPCDAEAGS